MLYCCTSNFVIKSVKCSERGCEGISLDQAKKSNCTEQVAGAAPMPREMSFPLGASENWNDVYDCIRYMITALTAVVSETLCDCTQWPVYSLHVPPCVVEHQSVH